MKQRIYNGHSLDFFDSSNNHKAEIKVSGSDLIINPIDNSGTVIIGEAGSINDIEVGAVGTAVDFTFLGGGTITSNGGTLVLGEAGDTIDLTNTTLTAVSASEFTGSFIGNGANIVGVIPDLSSYTGNVGVTGDLTVTGKVTAEEFHTEFVSSSIVFKSGSTVSGNSLDDIHTMTGSLNLTGSLALAGGAASITGGTLNLGSDSVAGIINSLGDVLTLAVDSNANTSGTPSIQFKSGSTELMRLNTTGLGIGTNTPYAKLHISGAAVGGSSFRQSRAGVVIWDQVIDSSGRLSWGTRATEGGSRTERVTFEMAGDVGIGVTNPTQKLHVDGHALISAEKYYYVAGTGAGFGSDANGNFRIKQNSSDLIFGSGSNVGIGKVPSTWHLDVDSATTYIAAFDGTNNTGIVINSNNTTASQIIGYSNSASSYNDIDMRANSTAGSGVYIDGSTSRVGIGTSSPLSLLQLSHYTGSGTDGGQSSAGVLTVFAATNTSAIFMGTKGSSYANRGYSFKTITNGVNSDFTIHEHGLSGERFRIKTGGNVGIGTNNPAYRLDVSGSLRLQGVGSFGIYLNGFTPASTPTILNSAGNTLTFTTSGGNTSTGAAYNFRNHSNTSLVSFNNNGNVGIGITSPSGALHVHSGDGGNFTMNTNHDDLVVEGSGNIGLQFLSPNSSYQYVAFGDTASVNAGYIRYHHGDNKMVFRTNGGDNMDIDNAGNLTITGGMTVGDSNADILQVGLKSVVTYGESTSINTTTATIKELAVATYQAVFYDFVIKNGTNLKAGTVTAVHDGTNVKFNEVSTVDLGDTTDVKLSVDINSGNMRLRATTLSNGWDVKAFIRAIKV